MASSTYLFFNALFGEVAPLLDVDQVALDQEVAFGVAVHDVTAHAHFVQAGHGRFTDLVDLGHVGQAVGQRLAQSGFLRLCHAQGQQGQA